MWAGEVYGRDVAVDNSVMAGEWQEERRALRLVREEPEPMHSERQPCWDFPGETRSVY